MINGIAVGTATIGTASAANITAQESAINAVSATTGVTADAFNKVKRANKAIVNGPDFYFRK